MNLADLFLSSANIEIRAAVLAAALLLDACAGEFPNAVHPVVWMGNTISFLTRLAPANGKWKQFLFGMIIATFVPLLFAGGTLALMYALRPWPVLQLIVAFPILKATFALRALGKAAALMRTALEEGKLDCARFELRNLCSRDSSNLAAGQLVAATIESVAENLSDSVVAPLFYYILLGLPGAVFYRAVNTLDSMIGYHGKYEYLGKASARFDDVLNYIPARLTAALILLGGAFSGQDVRLGLRTLARDGALTESPNAGRPMAAMAGLLHVELEKVGHYKLGNALEPLGVEKIGAAWRVAVIAACTGFIFYAGAMGALHLYAR